LSLLGHRRGTIAKCGIDDGGDAEDNFILIGAAGDLDADGKALGRLSDGNDGGGRAERIEPLGVADGVEVVDLAAGNLPVE
jgi:hypothetical protein